MAVGKPERKVALWDAGRIGNDSKEPRRRKAATADVPVKPERPQFRRRQNV